MGDLVLHNGWIYNIGSPKFIAYTVDITNVFSINVDNWRWLYVDDKQLQKRMHMCASGHSMAMSCTLLSGCRRRNRNTLLLLLLLWNSSKLSKSGAVCCWRRWVVFIQTTSASWTQFELIWFGSRMNIKRLQQEDTSLQIGSTIITPVHQFWTLVSTWTVRWVCTCMSAKWHRHASTIYNVSAIYVSLWHDLWCSVSLPPLFCLG